MTRARVVGGCPAEHGQSHPTWLYVRQEDDRPAQGSQTPTLLCSPQPTDLRRSLSVESIRRNMERSGIVPSNTCANS